MKQQVNLYQPMFRRQRRVFSAAAMVQSALLALIGLLAIYGYGAWQVRDLGGEVRRLENEHRFAAERLVQLQRDVPAREPSKILAAEVARLQRLLARRSELVATLERGVGSDRGFSTLLTGLARGHVAGTWITGFRLARDGADLELDGSANAPELVPRLVLSLGAEDAFRGRSFRALTIERPKGDAARVDFTLRTTAGGSQ